MDSSFSTLSLAALGLLAAAVFLVAAFTGSRREPKTSTSRGWIFLESPEGATEAEYAAAELAMINDEPAPEGFRYNSSGSLEWSLSAPDLLRLGQRTGRFVCGDESEDLHEIRIRHGRRLVAVCTRADGSITDDDGWATAIADVTLGFRLWSRYLAVEWVDASDEVYVSRRWSY
ncbi:MAG: hypothetical protein AAGI22_20790 [Planctomycetota bacterium]